MSRLCSCRLPLGQRGARAALSRSRESALFEVTMKSVKSALLRACAYVCLRMSEVSILFFPFL